MDGLGLSPLAFILVVVVLYIVLGFFIETLSLMVVTIPIIVPMVLVQGYDVIWFGILMIVLIEMALITPPVGLNLLWFRARASQAASMRSCWARCPIA